MIRIGIELNGVVRNINKQILKYYQKDINPALDLDDIDENDDVFKYAKFNSNAARNEFIYIDYPYEIFGCAKTLNKELPTDMNNWLSELTNYEEDDVEIFFFSMNEESLTIQSTYFFLSKIGTRVRKIIFPRSYDEILKEADVVITADVDKLKNVDLYKILIKNGFNGDGEEFANKSYNSLNEVIKDTELLTELHNFVKNKNDEQNKL